MDCYYCIIATDEDEVADLYVLEASDDEAALVQARAAAGGVAGWMQVRVHDGERLVATLERASPPGELPLAA